VYGREGKYRDEVIEEPWTGEAPAAEMVAEKATEEAAGTGAEADEAAASQAGDNPAKEEEKSPWDDPRLPWNGKPTKADIACWAAIVLSGLYYLAILPFRASLIGTHPVISELLNGSTEAIVAAAAFARVGHGSLAVAVLAAIPGLMKFDIIYWWAGRLWGEKIILLMFPRSKHGPKYMQRVYKWGIRFTWPAVVISPFLPLPNAIIYLIAGWAGMSVVTFLILDVIGTGLWVGMLAGLGYALGHHAVVIAQTISKYGLWFTIALVVFVVARQIWTSRRKR
jgi:membrane protein DedA with SNARE-associated domain